MKRKFFFWCALVLLFLYPFGGLFLHWALGWNVGELYTFGLELKDFLTVWIALGGVAGVVANFFLSRRRMETQQEQFDAQIEKQNAQIALQQQQQRDARFATGVELLGNPHESTRIGGAYSLYFLARDHAEYRPTVCEILCAHLRTIAHKEKFEIDEDGRPKHYPKNEVQSVIDLLFQKFENGVSIFLEEKKDFADAFLFEINISKEGEYSPILNNVDFRETVLTKVDFGKATLTEVYFREATLTDVYFIRGKLTDIHFEDATLTDIHFEANILTDIHFWRAKLTEVNFGGALLTNVYFWRAILVKVNLMGALTEVGFGRASLTEVDFTKHALSVNFMRDFICVDFYDATLTEVDFTGTPLEDYSYDEIVRPGRSLELTAPEEEKPG